MQFLAGLFAFVLGCSFTFFAFYIVWQLQEDTRIFAEWVRIKVMQVVIFLFFGAFGVLHIWNGIALLVGGDWFIGTFPWMDY